MRAKRKHEARDKKTNNVPQGDTGKRWKSHRRNTEG